MTRRKRNKPYNPKPTSLAGWVKRESIKTVGAALRDRPADVDIEELVSSKLSALVNSSRFKVRAKSARATERVGMERELKKIINALVDMHTASPDPEQLLADMFAKWPDLSAPDVDARMRAADPRTMRTLWRAGAETVITDADAALAESAGAAKVPDQQSLAAWIAAGQCPPEVLDEVASRLADVVGVKPDAVRVTGWAFGGLIVRHGGDEKHVPARKLKADARPARKPNPLAPLVRAWNERPSPIKPETRLGILPSGLAHIHRADRRAGKLFTAAAATKIKRDTNGQLIMSAVADKASRNPTLPPTLWGLGELPTRGGPGEAIATRVWVYAVRRVSSADWMHGQSRPLNIPMRDLLKLWPNRNMSTADLRRALDGAAEALASADAAWPWYDEITGEGGGWRVVRVVNVGHTLDGWLNLEISIPPGVRAQGAILPQQVEAYGANSKYAYRALITASFDWSQPGQTVIPNRRGQWDKGSHQAHDRDAYAVYGHDELVDMLATRTSRKHRADAKRRIIDALGQLASDGLMLVENVGRREVRMLPPGLSTPTSGKFTPTSGEMTPTSGEFQVEFNSEISRANG